MIKQVAQRGIKFFFFGVVAGLTLAACAGLFPYKYYGLRADNYSGALLGPTAGDDLDLVECKPDTTSEAKCSVMFQKTMLALKQDFIDCQNQLEVCQRATK